MRPDKSTLQKIFTAGYTAKGIVYVLIGIFAIATVLGAARSTNGPKAVIDWIGTNAFGQTLLGLIGTGLLAYCAWRWFRAVKDPGNDANGKSGAVKRIGWFFSGTAYGVLSLYTFKKVFGNGGSGGTDKQDVIARLLEQSWGQAVVVVIGVVVAGVGAYQLFRGVTDRHMEGVKGQHLGEKEEKVYRRAGRAGLAARAVVYGIIAWFLLRAGMMDDASQFGGISDALSHLRDYPLGAILLGVVGAGLLAYGLFMFVRARYETVY